MTQLEHNQTIDALEALVDKHGTRGLLNLIAEVASAKADHIREAWQDSSLADDWDRECALFLGYSRARTYVVQP
jgi:hypothetical protein